MAAWLAEMPRLWRWASKQRFAKRQPVSNDSKIIISDTPSSYRIVRHFDGVSRVQSPPEPRVRPVAGIPIQTDHVPKARDKSQCGDDLLRKGRHDETFDVFL